MWTNAWGGVGWLVPFFVWLCRIRHRKGYGIHSPWAFTLVTQVIYNNGQYYSYAQLDTRFRLHAMRLKTARLLFRLANDTQPHSITVPPGLPEAERAYLAAGCRQARIVPGTAADQISLDDRLTILLNLPRHKQQFKTMKSQPGTTTFDLYHLALVYRNLPTTPQHYIINFEL